MAHVCPECGGAHEEPMPTIEEIAHEESRAVVKATEAEGQAAVEVARIEGATAVQLEREHRKTISAESAAELAALMARVDVLEQSRIQPEPEPVPVVVDPPAPPPAPELSAPPPPETAGIPKAPRGKAKAGWWSNYS